MFGDGWVRMDRSDFLAGLKSAVDEMKKDESTWAALRAEDDEIQGANADGIRDALSEEEQLRNLEAGLDYLEILFW